MQSTQEGNQPSYECKFDVDGTILGGSGSDPEGYKAKAPMLWDLLFHLLNADIRSHKTWVPNTPIKVSSIPDLSDSTGGGNPIPNEALTLYEIVCKSSCFTNKPILTTLRKKSLSC